MYTIARWLNLYLHFKLEAENPLKVDIGRLEYEGEEKSEGIGEAKVAHLGIRQVRILEVYMRGHMREL